MSENSASSPQVSGRIGDLSSSVIDRRRMLLKRLGKGAVIVVATVPIQTLAATTLMNNGKICSISGMQSGVHSRAPTTDTCQSKSPGFYHIPQNAGNWPTAANKDAACTTVCSWSTLQTYVCTKKENNVTTVYRSAKNDSGTKNGCTTTCASPIPSTLADVMDFHQSSAEYHWIAAWLNALNPNLKFPYNPSEVIAFAKIQNPAAYNFFTTYMES